MLPSLLDRLNRLLFGPAGPTATPTAAGPRRHTEVAGRTPAAAARPSRPPAGAAAAATRNLQLQPRREPPPIDWTEWDRLRNIPAPPERRALR